MQIIKATFRGLNGSVGYKSGETYRLVFKENKSSFFFPRYPIEIWRAEHKSATTGYCPYSSMSAFLENWEIIE